MAERREVIQFYERASAVGAFMRWLARRDLRAIDSLLSPQPGLSLLDAGCGSGEHALFYVRKGMRVWAIDLAPALVERVRPHVERALVENIDQLELDHEFDRILCSGVLEFVHSPEECIRSLARHLAPEGRLIIMAPRPSLGGWLYKLWHRLGNDIGVELLSAERLDRAARAVGLEPLGARRPFFHNVVIGWVSSA